MGIEIFYKITPPYDSVREHEDRFLNVPVIFADWSSTKRGKAAAFVLITAVFVCWLGLSKKSDNPKDFYQFWVVGQAVEHLPVTNIYSEADRMEITRQVRRFYRSSNSAEFSKAAYHRRIVELAGTPFLYAVFYLVSSGNFDTDLGRFRIVSLISYCGGIALFCWFLGYSPWRFAAVTLALTWFFFPFLSDVATTNVNQIQLGGVALMMALSRASFRGAPAWAGFVAGALFMFKPNIVYVLGLLFILWYRRHGLRRSIEVGLGFLAAALVSYLLSGVLLGQACQWTEWYRHFRPISLVYHYLKHNVWTALGVNMRFSGSLYVGLGLFVAAAVLVFKTTERSFRVDVKSARDDSRVATLGFAIYLFSSMLVHRHYFLHVVPMLLAIFSPPVSRDVSFAKELRLRWAPWMLAAIAWGILAFHPIFYQMGVAAFPLVSGWAYSAVAILIGVGCYDALHESRRNVVSALNNG